MCNPFVHAEVSRCSTSLLERVMVNKILSKTGGKKKPMEERLKSSFMFQNKPNSVIIIQWSFPPWPFAGWTVTSAYSSVPALNATFPQANRQTWRKLWISPENASFQGLIKFVQHSCYLFLFLHTPSKKHTLHLTRTLHKSIWRPLSYWP